MAETGKGYVVYLLQLWHGEDCAKQAADAMAGWRASLTDPATRECRRFSSLSELFAYIEKRASEPALKDEGVSK